MMQPERRNLAEQERSIKDREQELFEERQEVSEAKPPLKPFAVYLRETPADPFPTEVKVILWIVAVLVIAIFVAALWRMRSSRTRPRAASPQATAVSLDRTGPYPGPCRHDKMGPWWT
jgi:hypothetical protein